MSLWSSELPLEDLRRTFQEEGWVEVDGALAESAAAEVARSIEELRRDFRLRVRNGVYPKTLTFDEPLNEKRQRALARQLEVAREHGLFSYVYYSFDGHPDCQGHAVCDLCRFLSTAEGWGLVESITGESLVKCEPAGVTRYHRGHYLAPHSDRLAKFGPFRRRVAYILYFCRDWTAEKGGLLGMAREGRESRLVTPGFNQLLLLDVDRIGRHWVTPVEQEGAERVAMPGFFCVPQAA
jgi:Rps23 Pro-64 3,4-dihydroxylase Tpa1-like proline 4-hydroxylase